MEEMIPVGFFIVGDGKFGPRFFGYTCEPLDGSLRYWQNRGYECVMVYVHRDSYIERYAKEV